MNAAGDALLETLTRHLRTVESIVLNPNWHAEESSQSQVRERWAAFETVLASSSGQVDGSRLQPLLERAEKLVERVRATILAEGIEEAQKMLDRSAATRAESSYLHALQPSSQPTRIDFKG